MNELTNVKEVDFEGAKLLAIKDEESGKIYCSVSSICNGISDGDKNFKDAQVKKIKQDNMLRMGCVKFDAGVFDENNNAFGIELDYLPIWLAKISITYKMIKEKPQLAQNLVSYQLKAKDVLAKVFVHKEEITKEDLLMLGVLKANTKEQQMIALKEYSDYKVEQIRDKEVKPLQKEVEYKEGVIIDLTKEITIAEKRQRITQIIRHNANGKFQERYSLLYEEFNKKYHIDVQRRLKNGKENGVIKKSANVMEYICSEKYMNMTSELYDLCVKVFEADFIDLLDEWKDTINK